MCVLFCSHSAHYTFSVDPALSLHRVVLRESVLLQSTSVQLYLMLATRVTALYHMLGVAACLLPQEAEPHHSSYRGGFGTLLELGKPLVLTSGVTPEAAI